MVKLAAAKIEPFLARCDLFKGADKSIVARAAALLAGVEEPAGTAVVTAGAPSDGLGIVFSGALSVRLPDGSEVETLGPADHFGDVALVLGGPSPTTLVATEPTRVLWMQKDPAAGLIRKVQPVAEAVLRKVASQLARVCAMERMQLALTELMPEQEPASAPAEGQRGFSGSIPFVEVSDFDLQPSVLAMIPAKLVRQHRILPLRLSGSRLTVGMVSPRNTGALAELRRTLPTVEPEVVAISADDFAQAVVRLRVDATAAARPAKVSGPSVNPDTLVFEAAAEADREAAPPRAMGDEVIRFVNRLIVGALDREASDVHIEPTAGAPRIRLRVHGVLQEYPEAVPPAVTLKALTARIKVLAGLDITERRMPQDGRIGLTAGKREVDLRVSTLPANRGEKIALRILEASGSTRQLEQIFFEQNTLLAVRRALNRPYGGILVCGPTGSGKTSTLYSLLNERKITRPDTNIMMVEDPIEYRLPGVTQVQVNTAAGLGFAQALRSLLRQDPDVIVVGETRDADTAVLALEAAMTGHLLFTSLHANDAMAAFQRLENLGCSRALVAQSIALVLVQRLVRKLCTACRTLEAHPPALVEALIARKVMDAAQSSAPLPRAVGCDACNRTGYVGRAVVVEAFQVTDEARAALASGRPLAQIAPFAITSRALLPFAGYAAALLQKQVISATEVLAALVE
ncbi:MAG: ATPase, T2SS/T4P/T4SS family [Myxococcales bacterium]